MNDLAPALPIMDTIKLAWAKTDGVKGTFWAALGTLVLVVIGINILSGIFHFISPGLGGFVSFLGQILLFVLSMGLLYLGIQRARGLPINYKMIFNVLETRTVLCLIGLYFLQGLMIIAPIAIIMGVALTFTRQIQDGQVAFSPILSLVIIFVSLLAFYLGIRLFMSMGFVLDRKANPLDAVMMSFKATKYHVWALAAIFILQFAILAISAIPFGIGLIWTLPFAYVIYGVLYNKLSAATPMISAPKTA